MKTILCFGDSNTYGYIAGTDHQRFATDKRWTGILVNKLNSVQGGGVHFNRRGAFF